MFEREGRRCRAGIADGARRKAPPRRHCRGDARMRVRCAPSCVLGRRLGGVPELLPALLADRVEWARRLEGRDLLRVISMVLVAYRRAPKDPALEHRVKVCEYVFEGGHVRKRGVPFTR